MDGRPLPRRQRASPAQERRPRSLFPHRRSDAMSKANQKVLQYLNEAHASEVGLVRVLQSQIAMTPRGAYRSALETHLRETRDHAERVERRIAELDGGFNPLLAGIGVAEAVIAQALALGKTPLDLLR